MRAWFCGLALSVALSGPAFAQLSFPVTVSGGDSGGIPYFSSNTQMSAGPLLAPNALMVGGGMGNPPTTAKTGSGVITALGVNTGLAGAFVVQHGVLGTPSSGTLTHTTGLPILTGVSGLGSGVATALTNMPNNAGGFLTYGSSASGLNFTAPGTGAVTLPAQTVFASTINGIYYGLRQGGSTNDSETGTIAASSNSMAISAIGDFQLGDDIRIRGAGATYSAGSPTLLSATQEGATGSTSCTYYISNDDGATGLSAAASVTIMNANASQTTANYVHITYTPPQNQMPGAVWKNCGSGEVYLGAAQPMIVATMTAGSGYTNGGPYVWTATGGGCSQEPQGFIVVGGPAEVSGQIATDLGRVDLAHPGVGCKSAPTVVIPSGAGAGTGGAITLSLVAAFDDAGQSAASTPEYVPSAHPSSVQNDSLVATIGAVSGTTLTLCTPGSYPGGCTPATATNSVGGASVRHSWTRDIQNAINASGGGMTGIAQVLLPCGAFEIEPPLTISTSFTVLAGSGECTRLLPSGIAATVYDYASTAGDGVENMWLDGSNKTAGYAADLFEANLFQYSGIVSTNNPGNLRDLGFNNLNLYDNPQCNNGWAWGYADYDLESTPTVESLQARISNTYCNDGGVTSSTTGITMHDGFRFNDFQTIYVSNQGAVSDAPGRGWAFYATTGYGYLASVGVYGNNFLHCFGCDAEFSVLDDVYVADCENCEAFGFLNGSHTGHELNVTAMPHRINAAESGIQWKGGKLTGAAIGGAILSGGANNAIINTSFQDNSYASAYTYPAIEVAAGTVGAVIAHNFIGGIPDNMAEPILLDAPVSLIASTAPSTGSPTITLATSLPSTISPLMTVYDSTIGATLGFLQTYNGDVITLWTNAGANGNIGDTVEFLGGKAAIGNNIFTVGNPNTIVDNSTSTTIGAPNRIGMNAGDAAPPWAWDNTDNFFGIGTAATFLNNGSSPGGLASESHSGGDVRWQVQNTAASTSGNTASFETTLSAVPYGYAFFQSVYGTNPVQNIAIGAGMTGGITVSSAGGGTSAPLNLTAGATRGVSVTPFVVPQGSSPTIASNACGSATQGTLSRATDMAGMITVGTTGVSSCTVSFAVTHQVAPRACVITPTNAADAVVGVSSLTATGFTISGTALDRDVYYYICM
jgi:hypothetical protein